MALRDTAPKVLEQEIRNFLHIPAETAIILERYSDSAASYVLLEPHNTPVYKQLYRAAKAKSKLKLRVSLKPQETAAAPKPVSMEDILEAAPPQISTEPLVPAPTSESAPSTLSLERPRSASRICCVRASTLRRKLQLSRMTALRRTPKAGHSWPPCSPSAVTVARRRHRWFTITAPPATMETSIFVRIVLPRASPAMDPTIGW